MKSLRDDVLASGALVLAAVRGYAECSAATCEAPLRLEAALAATGDLQRALIAARLAYRDGWGNEPLKTTSN